MDTTIPKIVLSLGLNQEETSSALNLMKIEHNIVLGSFDGKKEISAVIKVNSIEDLNHGIPKQLVDLAHMHHQDSILLLDANGAAHHRNLKTGKETFLGPLLSTQTQSVVEGRDYTYKPETKTYFYTQKTLADEMRV